MTGPAPLLTVDNLGIAFGQHAAMTGLSFTVERGETVALVGESGSGKSATALSLMRLIEREGGRITSGTVTLVDETGTVDITSRSDRQMRSIRGNRIAMIFQEPMTALNPVMTLGAQVAEVLALHRKLRGSAARKAVIEIFERVHIPMPEKRVDQYPHEISGGMRQRVVIAMALAGRPSLLIADEPTTALDVTTQAEILALIKELQAETGMGVVFITHDMGVVATMADRTVVLCRGKPVETGVTAELFASPTEDYTRDLLAAAPRLGASPRRAGLVVSQGEPVVKVADLHVRFPLQRGFAPLDYHAVNDVSLSIQPGETLGLVGESGCGKSTLARAIARLVSTSEGTIHLAGQDITHASQAALRPLRRRVQMVFQDPYASLDPRISVGRLVTEPARLAGMVTSDEDARNLARQLLLRVALPPEAADRYPHQFSGGQRQRICIARALSVRPSLIIADEAVSALDATVGKQVTDLLLEIQREEKMSCLFISHDLAVVERMCHRIAVMFAGQVVEIGSTRSVIDDPQHLYTRRLMSAVLRPEPGEPKHRSNDAAATIQRPNLVMPPRRRLETPPLAERSPGHFVRQPIALAAE